jgi:hypothetical protein
MGRITVLCRRKYRISVWSSAMHQFRVTLEKLTHRNKSPDVRLIPVICKNGVP